MDPSNIELEYIDLREFLFKFFDVDLNIPSIISICLQVALITWLMYEIYQRFRDTQAERVMRGLIMLAPLLLLFYLFKLKIITKLIEIFSSTMLIGLIVIFAPEFRRVLMQIGSEFSVENLMDIPESKQQISEAIAELIEALRGLKETKTGALIVLEKNKVDRYYVNPGHEIDAKISKELLLTIFSSKSPLHDGAVTIKGSTIMSAGVILPMTENPKLDWQYGTRHRAAIGFTEVTESLCIVVSEETGDLSIAREGRLMRCGSAEEVQSHVLEFYSYLLKGNKRKRQKLNKQIQEFFSLKKDQEKKSKPEKSEKKPKNKEAKNKDAKN